MRLAPFTEVTFAAEPIGTFVSFLGSSGLFIVGKLFRPVLIYV
jgi:hypothetical protein